MSIQQRRHRERNQRISRIQQAAISLFAQNGFKETSMDQIANEAELGKGTLYYYFSTKEEIFWAVHETIARNLYAEIKKIQKPRQTPIEFIRDLFRFYLDWFMNHFAEMQIMFPVGKNSPIGTRRLSEQLYENHRQPLEDHLNTLIAKQGCAISAQEIARVSWNYLMGISMQLVRGVSPIKIEEDVTIFIRCLSSRLPDSVSSDNP